MNLEAMEKIEEWQKSPIKFVEDNWGLTPQPLKPEYFNEVMVLVEQGEFKQIGREFFDTFVKGKHITWQQWLILLSVERALQGKGKRKISVVSGHGIGKDATLSWLIIWYLFCFYNAQVASTAPTTELMHDVLWKEIKIWLDKLPEGISKLYDWSNSYLRITESPNTWFARARTARKEAPEAIAGVHGDYVFIPVDEASGVPEEIFKTAEGSLTGENVLVVLISNGTRNEGYFYDTHHNFKHFWQTLSFSSAESPIVEDEFIEGIISKYGEESDEYRIRVGGQFPDAGQMSDGWVPLIEESKIIQISPGMQFLGKKYLGVDPAGEGSNESVWKMRDEFMEKTLAREALSTPKTIAFKTAEIIKEHELRTMDIWVDNFGEGANVARELALMPEHYGVNAVNWAEKADDEETYINKRAECYFRLRQWLLFGGAITDDATKRELVQIKYRRNLKGKIQIMEKKELVKLMGKSPDRADALALTFYETITKHQQTGQGHTINLSQNDKDIHSTI